RGLVLAVLFLPLCFDLLDIKDIDFVHCVLWYSSLVREPKRDFRSIPFFPPDSQGSAVQLDSQIIAFPAIAEVQPTQKLT
ncbi:hypothetical protein SB725_31130, partial [Pseudomonas sp. SIMBA_041]|uniref:hypothetical protein n=1 Tax=Pseudomonas sp. SIMBA_041 TaxID=3085782 RepID=UPI00397BB1B1